MFFLKFVQGRTVTKQVMSEFVTTVEDTPTEGTERRKQHYMIMDDTDAILVYLKGCKEHLAKALWEILFHSAARLLVRATKLCRP
jgi:hypothetical protein